MDIFSIHPCYYPQLYTVFHDHLLFQLWVDFPILSGGILTLNDWVIYPYSFLIDIYYFNSKDSGEGQENIEDLDHDYDLCSDLDFVVDIFVLAIHIFGDFAKDICCYY